MKENRFRIAGVRASPTCRGQVAGIRHDAYAKEQRIRVEVYGEAIRFKMLSIAVYGAAIAYGRGGGQ